jgi:hypothetical protein
LIAASPNHYDFGVAQLAASIRYGWLGCDPNTPNRIRYLAIGVNFTSAPLSLVASKPSLARFVTT